MMVVADRVTEIFDDAKGMHREALERWAAGDVRDAAEKAWGATKRATDGLILARTGWEPEREIDTARELEILALQDCELEVLADRYHTRMSQLYDDCFVLGLCEPVSETERRIKRTADYIQTAERLAQSGG